MLEFFKPGLYIDFMGKMRWLLGFSGALVLASLVLIAVRGLNFSIDFIGGYEIQVKLDQPVDEAQIKEAIAKVGVEDARVQRYGDQDGREYLIFLRQQETVKEADKTALKSDLQALAGGPDGVSRWNIAESGDNFQIGYSKPVSEDEVKKVLTTHGLSLKAITRTERDDAPTFNVELNSLGSQIEKSIIDTLKLPANADIVQKVEFVGPQVGAQLRNQGFMALLYATLFLLLYVAIRFDFYFAPGAIVALLHDIVITLGVYALLQIEFSTETVAALLTIFGYSINDTIVVYDRVRENTTRLRGRELRYLVSSSVSDTLSRTILTSSTIAVVVALIIWGGRDLASFSVALLVGFVAGTYSSFSIAAPCYVLLREHWDRRVKKEKVATPAVAS